MNYVVDLINTNISNNLRIKNVFWKFNRNSSVELGKLGKKMGFVRPTMQILFGNENPKTRTFVRFPSYLGAVNMVG